MAAACVQRQSEHSAINHESRMGVPSGVPLRVFFLGGRRERIGVVPHTVLKTRKCRG